HVTLVHLQYYLGLMPAQQLDRCCHPSIRALFSYQTVQRPADNRAQPCLSCPDGAKVQREGKDQKESVAAFRRLLVTTSQQKTSVKWCVGGNPRFFPVKPVGCDGGDTLFRWQSHLTECFVVSLWLWD
ncbi:MAG: hypothetical protein AAFY31_10800, partial [Pseudomonadota bacterium]